MKKSLLIALIGFMFVAFASCGGGSKEYRDAKDALKKVEKIIDNASTCEDLMNADVDFDMDDVEYADDELMTPEEEKEIKQLQAELTTKALTKAAELCNF